MIGKTHVEGIIVSKDKFELCGEIAYCSTDDAESNSGGCKTGAEFSIRGDRD